MGNTFPFVVFGTFGSFWLAFGATLQPTYNAYGAFSSDPSDPAKGLNSPTFNASFGEFGPIEMSFYVTNRILAYFMLIMGVLCFVFLICSIRTNVVFFLIFLLLVPAFGCLAGAYWSLAEGKSSTANTLLIAAGALTFVVDMLGWWIFAAIMLASLDFPFQLPGQFQVTLKS